jgi:hypothetical protein
MPKQPWVAPEVRTDIPPPPAKKPRKLRKPFVSPWVMFLRNRKPGDSFEVDYTDSCNIRGYCNKLEIEYRTVGRPTGVFGRSGWAVRFWIITNPFYR